MTAHQRSVEVDAVTRLRDRREIEELLARRAMASDRRDPQAMLACHTADATDDHGSGRQSARDFIAHMAATSYQDPDNGPQHHAVTGAIIEYLDRDTALVESYHLAYHRFGVHSGPSDNLIAGRYLDTMRRADGRWLIDHRTVVYDWSRTSAATRPHHTRTPQPITTPPLAATTSQGAPPMSTDHDPVAELLAKQEITEVLYRRARAGDRRDHALALSCYHDGATEEHEGFSGLASDFVLKHSAYAPGKTPPTSSLVHMITNVLIELHGSEAFVESYHLCLTTGGTGEDTQDTMIGGRYLDRFAHRDGRWAITHRTVVFDWSRVEPGAGRFWDRYPDQTSIAFGRMDAEDPLYAHQARTGVRP